MPRFSQRALQQKTILSKFLKLSSECPECTEDCGKQVEGSLVAVRFVDSHAAGFDLGIDEEWERRRCLLTIIVDLMTSAPGYYACLPRSGTFGITCMSLLPRSMTSQNVITCLKPLRWISLLYRSRFSLSGRHYTSHRLNCRRNGPIESLPREPYVAYS